MLIKTKDVQYIGIAEWLAYSAATAAPREGLGLNPESFSLFCRLEKRRTWLDCKKEEQILQIEDNDKNEKKSGSEIAILLRVIRA